jgi:hypothetical protein
LMSSSIAFAVGALTSTTWRLWASRSTGSMIGKSPLAPEPTTSLRHFPRPDFLVHHARTMPLAYYGRTSGTL